MNYHNIMTNVYIVGAAPFINGCTSYQHKNDDSWHSTFYKWSKLSLSLANGLHCLRDCCDFGE